jgi:hypothetical protein
MKIAGLKVRNGVVARGSRVRVTRGEERVYDGEFSLFLFYTRRKYTDFNE